MVSSTAPLAIPVPEVPVPDDVFYPDESPPQVDKFRSAIQRMKLWPVLQQFLTDQGTRALVGGDQFMYYRKGHPEDFFGPDLYVFFDTDLYMPDSLKLWEIGKAPDLIMEFSSPSTVASDTGRKRQVYEQIGVQEYILYDVWGHLLRPRLQGFRLEHGRYVPIPVQASGRLVSEVLGLELGPKDDGWLWPWDPRTGQWLPSPEEIRAALAESKQQVAQEMAARHQAERQAIQEAVARRAVEDELAVMRAELARLRQANEQA